MRFFRYHKRREDKDLEEQWQKAKIDFECTSSVLEIDNLIRDLRVIDYLFKEYIYEYKYNL